jgi:iron complex transport system permease protein
MVLVLGIARGSGRVGATSMLLAGMVLNATTGAALAFLRAVVRSSRAQETLAVLLGVVTEEAWPRVAVVAALALLGVGALLSRAPAMNLLALGDESAASLGVEVPRTEALLFLASSLAVAAVVSVCGLIPFVGLIVPHYARAWVGADHRALLPACFFGGAALLVTADAAARALFPYVGAEPPVGALTALVGAPFFLVMLKRMNAPEG